MRSRSFLLKVTILWAIALIFLYINNVWYAQNWPGACGPWLERCTTNNNCVWLGLCPARQPKSPTPNPIDECKKKCTPWNKISCECKCNGGIVLNTDIPFVGRCILKDGTASGWWTAISGISRALTSIFMTLILTWGFAMIIWWWVQISMGDIKGGRSKIFNVIVAFAVLWSLGILLRLINPNFFK